MSVIIRLQNLPWSANSYDIRQYFLGLSIPEGGVHIVGGELGDAFIAFSTDEDARMAMRLSGGKLKEVQVHLMLSSRNEMQKVIEAARSVTFPSIAAPPIQQQQQQQPQPVLIQQPQQQLQPQIPLLGQMPSAMSIQGMPNQKENHDNNGEQRDSRKRSRSRSHDRSSGRRSGRRDSRDSSRRRRSRSRDRDRRRRSRSRDKSTRDRYGRDIDKSRDDFKKSTSSEKDKGKDARKEKNNLPVTVPEPPKPNFAAPSNSGPSNPFGLPGNGPQVPFGEDRLSIAIRNTLSGLNMPLPTSVEGIPGIGGDLRKEPTPPRDSRNGRPMSPQHSSGAFPGFGDLRQPVNLNDLIQQNKNNLYLQSQLQKPNPSQVWLNPQPDISAAISSLSNMPVINSLTGGQNFPFAGNLPTLSGLTPNLGDNRNRNEDRDDDFRSLLTGRRMMDDGPTRGSDPGGPFGMGRIDLSEDRGRDPNLLERHPVPDRYPAARPTSVHDRGYLGNNEGTRDRFDEFGRNQMRRDARDAPPPLMPKSRSPDRGRNADLDARGPFGPRSRKDDEAQFHLEPPTDPHSSTSVELLGLGFVPLKDIRWAFQNYGCRMGEIRFMDGKRTAIKFFDVENKMKALRGSGRIFINDKAFEIIHITDAEFHTFPGGKSPFRVARNELPEEDYRGSRFMPRHGEKGGDGGPPGRFRDFPNRPDGRDFRDRNEPRDFPRDRNENRDNNRDRTDNRDFRRDDTNGDSGREKNNDGNKMEEVKIPEEEPVSKPVQLPAEESDCVIMSNLPRGTTDRDLCDFFSDIGQTPKKLHIMLDDEGEPSGEAYVEFWDIAQAKLACSKNGAPIGRNSVVVKMAVRKQMVEAVGLEDSDHQMSPQNNDKIVPLLPEMGGSLVTPPYPVGAQGNPPFPHGPGGSLGGPRGSMGGPRSLLGPGGSLLGPGGPGGPGGPRFGGPRPQMLPGPAPTEPDPNAVICLYNIPYRAGTEDIIEFFGPEFNLKPLDVFRKLNERGQPTSEARVVLPSPAAAHAALTRLRRGRIWDRPINMNLLSREGEMY